MKKVFYILIVAFIVIAAGCGKSTKDKLTGTWKLKSVEGQTLSVDDLNRFITMDADGKLTMKSGNEEKSGTWVLSEDEKTVDATSTAGDKETWHIISVDSKEFVFTVDTDKEKYTLEKQ
jgi:hypothetical protein